MKARNDRLAYARAALTHGGSRSVLDHHIDLRSVERTGKAITNFERHLPQLGAGFAFVGRQRLLDAKDDLFTPPPRAWIVDRVQKLNQLLAQRTEPPH